MTQAIYTETDDVGTWTFKYDDERYTEAQVKALVEYATDMGGLDQAAEMAESDDDLVIEVDEICTWLHPNILKEALASVEGN